jgi:thiol-disulfide isomerase/thioredoxin
VEVFIMKIVLLLMASIWASAGVLIVACAKDMGAPTQAAAVAPLPNEGELPSLKGATAWLNSPPLSGSELRGKVVLVVFWTYSCINSLRQVPYVQAWAEKYKDQGLVVIGVHAPEFAFEGDPNNVRRATKNLGITYPIAIDSDHAVWRAFDNQYWPALYFVDTRGKIRHHVFGEGEYGQSERVIQKLLAESGATEGNQGLVSVNASGPEATADWGNLQSQENYVGYERAANFESPGGFAFNKRQAYTTPDRLELNHWSLSGVWTVGRQATVLSQGLGRIVYRFHARDLHLVMGPAKPDRPIRFRVLIDGGPPGAGHGSDVDAQGNGTVTEHRMYQLIRQPLPIDDRTFEIEFLDPGVETFAFTFG